MNEANNENKKKEGNEKEQKQHQNCKCSSLRMRSSFSMAKGFLCHLELILYTKSLDSNQRLLIAPNKVNGQGGVSCREGILIRMLNRFDQ